MFCFQSNEFIGSSESSKISLLSIKSLRISVVSLSSKMFINHTPSKLHFFHFKKYFSGIWHVLWENHSLRGWKIGWFYHKDYLPIKLNCWSMHHVHACLVSKETKIHWATIWLKCCWQDKHCNTRMSGPLFSTPKRVIFSQHKNFSLLTK